MLSYVFTRLLTSVRPIHNYQQQFLRLLSTTENTSNDRQTGIVKRFSKDKGYGFISKTSDGTDCFVHFKNINTTGFKTLEQGQEVEFSIFQGEKGLEAKDVNIINAGTGRAPFSSGSSYKNSTSSRFGSDGYGSRRSGFGFGGKTSSELHSEDQDSTWPQKTFNFSSGLRNSTTEDNSFSSKRTSYDQKREIGSVKRWTGERGFGFIRRASGGPDLFCHVRTLRNGLQALEEGQTVQFRIQQTDKGEEARDVSIVDEEAGQSESPTPTNSNERQTGTVRRWLPEKGYGFLQRESGGSDLFVHVRDLSDGIMSLEEGQTVEFNIKTNEKGEAAENVTVRNES